MKDEEGQWIFTPSFILVFTYLVEISVLSWQVKGRKGR